MLGEGPETLVLVNGVGDDLEAWSPQVDAFLSAGLRLVTFDNRGVGQSSWPPGPYSTQQMAEDIKALVTELSLPPFHLAGVSMGGCIAQEYAIAHQSDLRSLILANTYAVADAFTRAAFESWGLVAVGAGMPIMMRQMAPWIFSPDFYASRPVTIDELISASEQTTQPASAFQSQLAALVEHDAQDRLGTVAVPTLVIAAADDIIIRPALSCHLMGALPSASWALIPGGHAAFWENPDAWNRAIVRFVAEHNPASEEVKP
jgi:3-oxoadipate enol-lactonase